jgi:hypothetical protein
VRARKKAHPACRRANTYGPMSLRTNHGITGHVGLSAGGVWLSTNGNTTYGSPWFCAYCTCGLRQYDVHDVSKAGARGLGPRIA